MPDPLRLAEFILPAALIVTVIALIADIVILSTRRAPARTREQALVGGPADAASPAPAPRPAKKSGQSGGLAAYATGFTAIAFLLITVYLGVRMIVTGHGPFANQHEFAVSFVWGILLAYLFVEWKLKLRALSVAVLPVAACLTLYAMRLDAGVEPLVPALQNNLLLTLHVGFAILAYGAACVSFGAAVLYLVAPKLRRLKVNLERLDEVGYKAAVVTFPLLTIMILLGALWADTAWGSYWSWDPKETAALVTWLIYGAFLHARVVRGWRGRKSAWLLIIGFAAILFAYFGNNFFGGLHSYA
ncbi:MAG: c-type cytochrome biogenesis protein CcsB [Propionibacteriaceae bacterium]|jgi:cytochrome c-type biogenesis protein CcsB|nr:c-type cytochrome biogenesis protein CcsB [Propionibacteriaceae bacterium]